MPSLLEQFEALRNKEAKKLEDNAKYEGGSKDDRFLNFPVGTNDFRVRLCFLSNPDNGRVMPWISQHVHSHWFEADKKRVSAVCPSSQYLEDRQSFFKKLCPVCTEASKQYKLGEQGSQTAKDLYSILRRNFNVYAVVYVVKDPVHPENNGTFKILRGGYTIFNFLQKYVLGINEDGGKDKAKSDISKNDFMEKDAEVIGVDAFKIKDGYDLIIGTSPKTEKYNQYACSFSRKSSTIPITEEEIAIAYKDLKFDESFYLPWDIDSLNTFLGAVTETSVTTSAEPAAAPRTSPPPANVDKELEELGLAASKSSKSEIVEGVEKPAKTKKVKEEPPASSDIDIDDIDVDALLEGL